MKSFLADFHVHSNLSDGKIPLPEVIDLYGKRNFGAIAITDHIGESNSLIGKTAGWLRKCLTKDTFPEYMKQLNTEIERAWDQYNMVVIPGFELSKNSISNYRSAHILGIGVTEFLSADEDASVLIDKIHEMGALAIAAHPVHTRKLEKQTYHLWNRREELAQKFDAWEVASGPFIFEEVLESPLPKIASSDLHIASQLRSWKTQLHCERHPGAILEAIRKQEFDLFFYE